MIPFVIQKSYRIDVLDKHTCFISNRFFNFSYTKADSVVKDEFKGKYRYFGGLQCEYEDITPEYKELEQFLVEKAESILK